MEPRDDTNTLPDEANEPIDQEDVSALQTWAGNANEVTSAITDPLGIIRTSFPAFYEKR